MFVVMALVTTVATTPLTKALYPPWYQKKVEKWRRGETDWDGNPIDHSDHSQDSAQKAVESQIRRLMVHLRLDSLPSLFTFITLLSPESVPVSSHPDTAENSSEGTVVQVKKRPLEVHGLRVIELSDRTSSVMHLTSGDDFYSLRDPVVNAFRAFSQLHDVAVSARAAVVPTDSYAETIMTHASEVSSDFALIPWGEYGSLSEDQSFPVAMSAGERFKSSIHLDFINETLQKAARTCNTGIFIDNGFGGATKPVDRPDLARTKSAMSIRSYRPEMAALPVADKAHHIFLPFFGGPDDHVAIRIVLQLAKNQHVTASIVQITWSATTTTETKAPDTTANPSSTTTSDLKSTPTTTTTTTDQAQAHQQTHQQDCAFFATMRDSLPSDLAPRVVFTEATVASLADVVALAQKTVGLRPKNAGDVVVLGRRTVVGNHGGLGVEVGGGVGGGSGAGGSGGVGASGSMSGGGSGSNLDLKRTVGPVAEQLVTMGVKASLLVVQAAGAGAGAGVGGKGVDGY
jgi:hypothetical protein